MGGEDFLTLCKSHRNRKTMKVEICIKRRKVARELIKVETTNIRYDFVPFSCILK